MTTDLTILRKKLIYRSHHRGTREMDFFLSKFADHHLASFTKEQLDLYEQLLHIPDPELHAWIMGVEVCTDEKFLFIIKLIKQFHQIKL